ncbi:uncharacterized protein ColSpa_03853 [Colletotrichum spaethianum]|uniref:Uncharacterized protein n=1 Tax=Colletotrichum spaethianum TaxID=700344 RepID=A0AA37NVW1_9PEZI|nr:uncharacterized protein ColSpa_03853 [Colletotrichum spaethianum]GKT43672.1 hypothetical protein ColSpa_03853 [Colletotrichum spaethianum]
MGPEDYIAIFRGPPEANLDLTLAGNWKSLKQFDTPSFPGTSRRERRCAAQPSTSVSMTREGVVGFVGSGPGAVDLGEDNATGDCVERAAGEVVLRGAGSVVHVGFRHARLAERKVSVETRQAIDVADVLLIEPPGKKCGLVRCVDLLRWEKLLRWRAFGGDDRQGRKKKDPLRTGID